MDASIIYLETVKALKQGVRRLVHQGGQWSGKTVNILGSLAQMAIEDTEPGVTTITSQSMPQLKGGALRDFENFVHYEFKNAIAGYNKTDHVFTFHNGSIYEFKTFDNETKARGAKRKRLFINEANTFDYMTYFQLDSRSEQTILDYNPTIRFWAHDKVIGEPGTEMRISDHRHNPFLTEDKHREIESIKDKELWKVYARGMTGNVIGLIYPDWTMIEEEDIPEGIDNWIYGIDYGYTNDPTAIVSVGRQGENLYIKELTYQTGTIPPLEIKRRLEFFGYNNEKALYSEHDADMVRQLRLLSVMAIPARKGPGSIKAGIEKLKEYKIFYTSNSRNIKRELGLYIWEHDDLGNSLNIPVDANNHALDAVRYAVYSHFYRQP